MVLDGLGAAGGLRDQYHVQLAVDDGGYPLPEKWMVIDTKDADLTSLSHGNLTPRQLRRAADGDRFTAISSNANRILARAESPGRVEFG